MISVTGTYTDIGMDTNKEYFVQNTSSTEVELFISSSPPVGTPEGFILAPRDSKYIKLSDGEAVYVKSEGGNAARLVTSPEVV